MDKLSQIISDVKQNRSAIFALARSLRFCDTLAVVKAAQSNSDGVSASFDSAWDDVREDAAIQFSPTPVPEAPESPQWWRDFLDWLGETLQPVFEMVSDSWPILRIILLLMLAAGVLTLIESIDPGHGGNDVITTGLGADIVIGGAEAEVGGMAMGQILSEVVRRAA